MRRRRVGQMANNAQINELQLNKLMKTAAEVAAFESALSDLARSRDPDDLLQLYGAFTDATEQHDVMWGLLHFVESFGMERHFQALVRALPAMLPDALGWAETLHCRMLNSEACRDYYKGLVRTRRGATKKAVEKVLKKIRDGDASFASRVQEVLGG